MGNVDLNARIPNNVGLRDDRRLQRALEAWQPHFINWWQEMGPEGFQADQIYLRTAVDVGRDGGDLAFGEVAREIANHPLLFVELKVHGFPAYGLWRSGSPGKSCGIRAPLHPSVLTVLTGRTT